MLNTITLLDFDAQTRHAFLLEQANTKPFANELAREYRVNAPKKGTFRRFF